VEFPQIEGLGEIIVGPDFQTDDPVDGLPGAGKDDDADVVALAQVAGETQSVLAGQPDVQQDHAAGPGRHQLPRLAAIGRREYRAIAFREVFREHLADRRVVIDDEHRMALVHAHLG
jgi:hypothetical protein